MTYAKHITIDETLEKHHLTWFNGGIDDGLPDDTRAALEVLDAIHEVYISVFKNDKLKLANASIWLGIIVSNAHFALELGKSGLSKGKARIDNYEKQFYEYRDYYQNNIDPSLTNEKAAEELLKYSVEVAISTLKNPWIPKFKRGEDYKK